MKELLKKLKIEDKIKMLTGNSNWTTYPIKEHSICSVQMNDGPHGVRKKVMADSLGNDVEKATCFPTASALACTWNKKLLKEIGKAIATECNALGVNVILGPGINLKRIPLCGRNFEYFSEDPVLSGELAASMIIGIQSQGVGAVLKHYALNNQEENRFQISAEIDERTMRELYLKPFQIAVKKGKPSAVMCSYNRINGVYASENHLLLTQILRNEWRYKGIVISDWGAVHNRYKALKAGLDLEMPANDISFQNLLDALHSGKISIKEIDRSVERLINWTNFFKPKAVLLSEALLKKHHMLAKKAASEAITLLKNEQNLLPLNLNKKIVVIGEHAQTPNIQGNGSSYVNPSKIDNPFFCIKKMCKNEVLFYGKELLDAKINTSGLMPKKISEAVGSAQAVIIFVGNEFGFEGEGFDRPNTDIPHHQRILIETACSFNQNVVVVINVGGVVNMSGWVNKPKAILQCFFGGQSMGSAVADVIFGKINPNGKLSESYPKNIFQLPSMNNYFNNEQIAVYSEGQGIGYRYFDEKKIAPLFEFGFGLSYTVFNYKNLLIEQKSEFSFLIKFEIENVGNYDGYEITQMYVSPINKNISKPVKELKAFEKVFVKKGKSKIVFFSLNEFDLSWFCINKKKWVCEGGLFNVFIGASSADIRLKNSINTLNSIGTKYI